MAYVSAEMSARALLQRLLAQIGAIEISRLWRGPLGPQHHATLARAAATLAALPLHIVDLVRDWPLVAEECRRLVHRGVRLLVIDYLGLLTISGARVDRWEMIGMITSEAKRLALTLDVPVLLLCQLNRESTREANKRPALWHLRDSGAIEQDSDLVGLRFGSRC